MTLTQLFTAIANAIRSKKGTSGTIVAEDFPTEIESIEVQANLQNKSVTITENGTTNISADSGYDGLDEVEVVTNVGGSSIPDWSEIGYSNVPQALLDDFAYSKNIYDNWDASVTDLVNKFYNNKIITYMPLVNTSNVTRTLDMFYGCSSLKSVPLLDTSNVGNMAEMFRASSIQEIPVLNTSNVKIMSGFVNGCSKLSNESLNNIMRMCINATATYTQTKTLAFIGMTSAQATICQSLSNWNDFVAAGWSTGY